MGSPTRTTPRRSSATTRPRRPRRAASGWSTEPRRSCSAPARSPRRYTAPPSEKNAALWAERTPAHFTFNVKAFSLMTQHPAAVRALPKDIRELAPSSKTRVYPKDLPPKAIDTIFEMFASALMPLHSAGKLGYILFQFPEWFVPGDESRAYIARCAERLPDFRVAVEFRRGTWV